MSFNVQFSSHKLHSALLCSALICFFTAVAQMQQPDTLHHRKLKELEVNGQQLRIARASMPEQLKSEKEISTLNAVNVADVAKHFSGVIVKDYGGIGGFKTVSLRGLGAQHTGVSYDGLILSDVQSGEVDLGRFTTDNIAEISLNNAQPNDIFQPARAFASSGVLSFRTKLPNHSSNHNLSGKVTAKTGSFGMYDAGIFLMQNLNQHFAYNFFADGQLADSKYKFIQHYGQKDNKSETLTRTNSDIQAIRSELNLLYRIRERENLTLKANLYLSERGLPGSVVYYNTFSSSRLWDKAFFTQLGYENRVNDKLQYQCFAKFNSTYNRYRNTSVNYPEGVYKERFQQNEYYLSASLRYAPVTPLQFSASTDWWYNDLDCERNINYESSPFKYPTRHTGLMNVAAKYFTERFMLGANLLYTLTREKVRVGNAASDRNQLSPTLSITYKILKYKELRLRAFYKDIFRLPTFNDLYYQNMGNTDLRPEKTKQFNLGFTFLEDKIPHLSELFCSIDGYYNRVSDKIIILPIDFFHCSTVNKGRVDIKGIDANVKMIFLVRKVDKLNVSVNFTYQKATDVTANSENYGEQISYTPFYSGSASASYKYKQWEVGYNLLFSGKRWKGQNIVDNKLDAFQEHSVFANLFYKRWKISGEMINLMNTSYEIIKFNPMPGRNFRITLTMNF